MSVNGLQSVPCLLAYMDVQGAEQIFKRNPDIINEFVQSLDDLYNEIISSDGYRDGIIKINVFSDNILILTEDCRSESFDSLIQMVAEFQFKCLIKHKLLLRGGVSDKKMYHNGVFSIGEALIDAYHIESRTAYYPRVIISDNIQFCDGCGFTSKERDNLHFVDYLRLCIGNEDAGSGLDFVDHKSIKQHRDAIIEIIRTNNGYKNEESPGKNFKEWDAIRSKYLWLIYYHNRFCEVFDVPYPILFKEILDDDNKFIIDIESVDARDVST